MKTTKILSLASALSAALFFASVASAQSAPKAKRASSDKLLASATDSAMVKGKPVAAASVTYAQLRTAMGALPDQSNRFVRTRGLRREHITLVDVRNLFRYSDDQKNFEHALMQFDRQITEMRSTLQSSIVLRDLLYERQLKMSQVIGVESMPDGRAIVYYQPE